jgi:hypothetical protein
MKRSQKKQDADTNSVISSFARTIDESFQAEVEYITGELKKNRSLTYTLSGLLKNDGLIALLDGRLVGSQSAASSPKANSKRRLKAGATKFKHLVDVKGIIGEVLKRLLPKVFTDEVLEGIDPNESFGIFCMALAVTPTTSLPHKYYPDLVDIDSLISACSQRYEQVMKAVLDNKDLDEMKGGFYGAQPDESSQSNTVQCILCTHIESFKDADSVTILEPFDMDSGIEVKSKDGRKLVFNDLKDAFQSDHGVVFPVALGANPPSPYIYMYICARIYVYILYI